MDQPQPGEIIEGAQAIRPHLKALVGEQAASIDTELTTLLILSQQPGQSAEAEKRLLFTLSHEDATREWLFNYFRARQQEDTEAQLKDYEPLPGPNTPVPAATYCCPQGDYTWIQYFVGVPVPQCPTHHVYLQLC